jgi:hypothetical protein
MALAHQFHQAGAVLGRVADAISASTAGECGRDRRRQAEIGQPHDLALAHRNAAEDLRQILAEPDADQQLLDLAEPALRRMRSA